MYNYEYRKIDKKNLKKYLPRKPSQQERLSNYPSEAILQALDDLEWIEKSKNYSIYMGSWARAVDGHCSVCQAGAIMARRYHNHTKWFDHLTKAETEPHDMEGIDSLEIDQIISFDNLRDGCVMDFLRAWICTKDFNRKRLKKIFKDIEENWVTYGTDPKLYKKQLRKVAKILDKEGF